MDDLVVFEQSGGLATITLNRPDRANALTVQMLQDLTDAVGSAQDAAVLVLTGRGKVFSAGADLAELPNGIATDPSWEALSASIAAHPGLTVAQLNGTVAGGAFGMVLACDIRIAVPQAKFFYPVLANKVAPQPSDPGRLARLVGPSRAAELLCFGSKITADTALDWGLINEVVDGAVINAHVAERVAVPLGAGQDAVRQIKRMMSA